MQRVRIGLTGLAFVFVLVLLAAVFTTASDEEPITANSIAQAGGNLAAAQDAVPEEPEEPAEPLAELGVAPGNPGANSTASATNQVNPAR